MQIMKICQNSDYMPSIVDSAECEVSDADEDPN